MNKERNQLLDDIFCDDAGCHEDLLKEVLCRVRRRRQRQIVTRVGLALFMVGGLLSVFLNKPVAPIPTGAAVASRSGMESFTVVSTVAGSVSVITSSAASVTLVATAPVAMDMISDERMLALFSPRRALLIWRTPGDAELVFSDSSGENHVQ